jgi:CelD/BcsL family acetyltransferase involved in cellulose biosynthesis
MRKRRKLEREHGGPDNIRFEAISSDQRALRKVIEWKISQCERTGTPVFFREAWAVEMIERLLAQEAPGCAGALSVLWVGDEVAAAHFGIRSRGVWHWWFPTYSEEWSQYSPGKLLLLETCGHVADSTTSWHTIDLGKGDDSYKASFANAAYPLLEGSVSLGSAYHTLRSAKRRTMDWARTSPILLPIRQFRRAFKDSPLLTGFRSHRR